MLLRHHSTCVDASPDDTCSADCQDTVCSMTLNCTMMRLQDLNIWTTALQDNTLGCASSNRLGVCSHAQQGHLLFPARQRVIAPSIMRSPFLLSAN